jgi:hypothetical protein
MKTAMQKHLEWLKARMTVTLEMERTLLDEEKEQLRAEISRAFIHGQGNGQMMEAGLERDEVDDYTNSRMLSLNKKD